MNANDVNAMMNADVKCEQESEKAKVQLLRL